MERKGMLIIMAKVAPENEEAFTRWYNDEHLPRVLERLPGAISGRSYRIIEGEQEYQFLVLYEFESPRALYSASKSDAMKQLVEEYTEAFGEGGRKRLKAIEINSLVVG
jgi:antibiotic biosynthesis monooxygenase (ABM) superfamily enzyme